MLGRWLDRLAELVNIEWKWADATDIEWEPDAETAAAIGRLEERP